MSGRIIIVGGGIVGATIAYHLVRNGHRDVVVLEAGDELGGGATAKATGGIRQQFTSEINARLVQRSVAQFLTLADDTGSPFEFRQHGYLFVIDDEDTMQAFRESASRQRSLGIPTQVVTPDEAADLFPGMSTERLLGGTYCATDGSASPSDALMAYVAGARRLGAEFRLGQRVTGITRNADDAVTGVLVRDERIEADAVVLAPGPSAREVGALAGVDLPVTPRRRQAFTLSADLGDTGLPLTIDMGTGAYVHPENANTLVAGGADRDAASASDAQIDWDIVPDLIEALADRFPALAEAGVGRGWAGFREMTPDDHALVGALDGSPGLWVAVGFSGHGFMQAPAIGESVAGMLLGTGEGVPLDALRPSRFAEGRAISEAVVF